MVNHCSNIPYSDGGGFGDVIGLREEGEGSGNDIKIS